MRSRPLRVEVYFNEREYENLCRLCKETNLKRGRLIRLLLEGYVPPQAPPVDYKQFIIELRRVGTNLNQLTAKANAIGLIDRAECREVLSDIRSLESDIAKYFKPGKGRFV